MAIKKSRLLIAFLITAALFGLIFLGNLQINDEREKVVLDKMDMTLEEYKELQTITILTDVFGSNITCLAFKEQLADMDESLWDAGQKLDRYRALTEEFVDDPFYVEQKVRFNRNQAMYFAMLKKMKKTCASDQEIILYFYRKKSECKDCDAQSFVLTDINEEIDDEISVFSFDADLNLSSVSLLQSYYDIDEFPCVVIEDTKYCGLMDKDALIDKLCQEGDVSLCR